MFVFDIIICCSLLLSMATEFIECRHCGREHSHSPPHTAQTSYSRLYLIYLYSFIIYLDKFVLYMKDINTHITIENKSVFHFNSNARTHTHTKLAMDFFFFCDCVAMMLQNNFRWICLSFIYKFCVYILNPDGAKLKVFSRVGR